jgi:hypothetical protein
MGWAFGMYGRKERRIQSFGGDEEKRPLEDLGVDGRIILRWIVRKKNGGVEWVNLAQDRDRWRAVVNAVISLRVL